MSLLTVSLVTADTPHARLDHGIASVTFGAKYGDNITIQLPASANPTEQAAWFRRLRDEAGAVAILIERENARIA